jgi:hypothetical protein
MSWQTTNWKQVNDNYPIPVLTNYPKSIDLDKIYTSWKLNASIINGYPYPSVYSKSIDLDKIYANFRARVGIADGYPSPLNRNNIKIGAFAYLTDLTSIKIPIYVTSIGKYSFYNTSLASVTIAPDCSFYATSFPCPVSYYTTSIYSVQLPSDTISFNVGDDWEKYMKQTVVKLQITDGSESVIRDCNNISFIGVSTDEAVTDATGTIIISTYNGTQLESRTFTYSVT